MNLYDIEQWCITPDSIRQKEAKSLLVNGLGKHFSYESLIQYRCEFEVFTIARFKHIKTDMTFHLIPGCLEYKRGLSPELYEEVELNGWMDLDENDFEQRYPIKIPPFLIAEYVITNKQWAVLRRESNLNEFDDNAVNSIDRKMLAKHARSFGLRLPSEVEWEYACKAGTQSLYYWGNKPDERYAYTVNNNDAFKNQPTLSRDQQLLPNAFGLLGMLGNIAEWVSDDAIDYSSALPSFKPYRSTTKEPDGVLRGGWVEYDWKYNRTTSRIRCNFADNGCSARLAASIT